MILLLDWPRPTLPQSQVEALAPEPSGDWRADLRGYAGIMRAALLRHPWAIDFLGTGPPAGPNDARNAERLMETLDGLGLDIVTALRVLTTFGTYVVGAALREIQEIRWGESLAETTAGMTEGEIDESIAEFGRRIRERRLIVCIGSWPGCRRRKQWTRLVFWKFMNVVSCSPII